MDAIRVHVFPAQSERLGFSEPGEEQKAVVGRMDRVLEFADDPAPLWEVIDDPPVRLLRVPV